MLPLYMKNGKEQIRTASVHQYIPKSYPYAQQAVYMGKTLAEITNMTPFTRGQYVPVLVTNKGHTQARYSQRKPTIADTHARHQKSRHMVNIPRNSKASFEGARTGSMVFGNPSYGEVVSGTEGWATYTWDKATGIITYTDPSSGAPKSVAPGTATHTAIVSAVNSKGGWSPTASASGAAGGAPSAGEEGQGGGFNWNTLFTTLAENAAPIITAVGGGGATADPTLTTTGAGMGPAPSYLAPSYNQSSASSFLSPGKIALIVTVGLAAVIVLPRVLSAARGE